MLNIPTFIYISASQLLTTRISDIEGRVAAAHHGSAPPVTPPLQDTDRCVVAQGLAQEEDEDLPFKVAEMLSAMNLDDLDVVDVARLPHRQIPGDTRPRPGLVKIAMRSKEQKLQLL